MRTAGLPLPAPTDPYDTDASTLSNARVSSVAVSVVALTVTTRRTSGSPASWGFVEEVAVEHT